MHPRLVVVVVMILLPSLANTYSILAMLSLGTKSHFTVLRPLLEELMTRGHNITLLSICPSNLPGIEEFVLDDVSDPLSTLSNPFDDSSSKIATFMNLYNIFEELEDNVRSIFESEVFIRFSKATIGRHYDVVILSITSEILLPFAYDLGAPIVLISPPLLLHLTAWQFNVPTPHSYVPSIMGRAQPPFTFLERFINAATDFTLSASMWYMVIPTLQKVVAEYFPDMPPLQDMRNNVSLVLVNQHVSFQNARPQMPNVIDIGGIHCRPANPLPKEFSDFVAGSEANGFIVFSLGSAVNGNEMPEFILDALLQGFGRLQQRVIWKIEGIKGNIPENVLISKWLPQQDLLGGIIIGHPFCKLAIMHGGLMSLQEAIYHGVPVLGFPLGVDRDNNLLKAVQMGIAKTLDWRTLTADVVYETISQMVNNDSYSIQAQKYSALNRDTMRSPRETGAFWVEYVVRHKGAHHLKSMTDNLNLMQYLLLDIIGVIFIIMILFMITVFAAFKTCCHRSWSWVSNKQYKTRVKNSNRT